MYTIIHGNLDRQSKALSLLAELLDEEFSLLRAHQTSEVMELEFSIHELVRQIAHEKTEVRAMLQGIRAAEYADMLEDESRQTLHTLLDMIDNGEQACARQSAQNSQLSLALLEQSQELLNFVHKRVIPQQAPIYGRKGGMASRPPEASLLSGRL